MSSDFVSMSFQADIFTIGLSKQFSRFLNAFQVFVYFCFNILFKIYFKFYALLIRRRFTDMITELLLPVCSDLKLHDFFF